MGQLGNLKARDFEKVLRKLGYELHHQRGSHKYYVRENRIVTIPFHKGKSLGKGLSHKIITRDMGISIENFFKILKG